MTNTLYAAVSLSVALSATAGADPWREDHPLRRIRSETLVYKATAWKGIAPFVVTIPLGKTTFRLERETHNGEVQLVLKAHAVGGVPQNPLDATMTARLRDRDFLMRYAESSRTQPSYKLRVLRFHDRGADYLKHKHCEAPTLCHNP
ncbi:MAG: hypothetical protein ACODAJ_05250, partial [Planctomycetota bacterium]